MSDVTKAALADSYEYGGLTGIRPLFNPNDRGINIYNLGELEGVRGRTDSGDFVHGTIQRPIFVLSVNDRVEMFKRAPMLQGVITSRAKRVSALNWKVKKKDNDIDKVIYDAKEAKEIFDEYNADSMDEYYVRYMAYQRIKRLVPGVKEDMSNFDAALRRYRKQCLRKNEIAATEIEEWLREPSMGVSFEDFRHAYVIDQMVHGGSGIYKRWSGDKIDDFFLLPGGTVFPYRGTFVGGPEMYMQIIPTFEVKAYFAKEISYMRYLPVSWQTLGELPLEALVNKIAETILFDKRSADQADGTKPPEKAIAFGKQSSPFGNLTSGDVFDTSMDTEEQKRIETKMNLPRREAIITLEGVGHPAVIDLSKADTFSSQAARQDKLLRDIALVYNMTNMEVNLAGGEFTSGKETSDVQKEIEQEKGIGPTVKGFQYFVNRDILPFRYGQGWEFTFDIGLSDAEQAELEQKQMATGTYAINEIRENRGDEPWPEDEYNRPQVSTMGTPDGSVASPFNVAGNING